MNRYHGNGLWCVVAMAMLTWNSVLGCDDPYNVEYRYIDSKRSNSSTMSSLGVVVVGVGRAGGVRVRDLVAEAQYPDTQLPNVTLKGFVSRRDVEIAGAQKISMEDALKDAEANAFFICNENALHETTARQALEAGKHVLVEFPLATNAAGAKSLYELAESKGLTLYEEDISLLTASHNKAKELIQEKGLKEIQINVVGRPNGWIENLEKSGPPFVTGISMLHRVIEYTGKVVPQEASINRKDGGCYEAVAKLLANDNIPVTLTYTRDPEQPPRRVTFSYTLGDGTVLTEKSIQRLLPQEDATTRYGLFMKDSIQFMKTVRGERDMSAQKKLTIEALEIADELYRLAKQSPNSANL